MSYPTTMVANNHMDDYVEKLQKIANYRGVPFLDLYHGSNLRPENETNRNACFYNESSLDGNGDGVHPNELGHRIIAPKIYEFLKTLLLD
jgi:lysophospholipase L1-like esterase